MPTPLQEYTYRLVLQGDVASILALFGTPEWCGDPAHDVLRERYHRRFVLRDEPKEGCALPPWVQSLLGIYQAYYCRALLAPEHSEESESWLLASLAELHGTPLPHMETCQEMLQEKLSEYGLFSMLGKVSPYYALHIWRTEEERLEEVELPLGTEPLTLCIADDFLALGWMHFATFGEKYSGGWLAREDIQRKRFYRVKQAYDRTDPERFRIFLVHEAQHLQDLRCFPHMEEADLEYRAKLAELAMAKDNKPIIKKLSLQAAPNPTSPHAYASHCVVQQVGDWDAMSIEALRLKARLLLEEHTKALRQ